MVSGGYLFPLLPLPNILFYIHTNLTVIMYQNREECNQRGGTEDGTCASGFGVCCICKFSMLTAKLGN